MTQQKFHESFQLSPNLTINRVLTGLWQVADIERKLGPIDPKKGADDLQQYVNSGFKTFDMADHYGTAEIITGTLIERHKHSEERPVALTKWCPSPGPMTADLVRKGIEERCKRLRVDRLDLLQFHWWNFEHSGWLDALHELVALRQEGLISEIGVTNFDAAHLHLALADGVPLISNQVSFSLLDRRATGPLRDICTKSSVHLLGYGTLCGGFLSEKWLGTKEPDDISDWSKMKYKRFIDASGGWNAFQDLLLAASEIAKKHDVSISNVATRWVLEQEGLAAVIIGARLGENIHADDNSILSSFALDAEDHKLLENAFDVTQPIPGDCGDEYRKPPFLTASGDLSHHLDKMPRLYEGKSVPQKPEISRVSSGSNWEKIAGYCRAQRVGNHILVSGTTATAGKDRVVAPGDAAAQTTFILDKILAAISALGASAQDIVRTRIYLTNEKDASAVSIAHGHFFSDIQPANTLIVVAKLIGDYCVEIEAEALVLYPE